MGAKREKKTGKGRLDKYYKLAKEQGYRARSAFKLVQLDKKFNFLESAHCLIDLCAAPGGWLQVAAKYMPNNSVIVGVDLAPIKPIPRCTTFVEDITTEACKTKIRAEVKDWKADVVLHDGAPNVGTAWVQDAFTQAELVLSSLKLATAFLAPGATFVTKVFRSKDYNSLLWVFNQFFKRVEATKPPSSRNVSAEIFVVCTGYLAPRKIDPKLLDPVYVFKDLEPKNHIAGANVQPDENSTTLKKMTSQVTNIFAPEKKRRKREGYDDGDYTLFRLVPVENFIQGSDDPIAVLSQASKFDFTSDEGKQIANNPLTTAEIKAASEDLKVLGKRDFKNLLKWRVSLREQRGLDVKAKATPKQEEVVDDVEVTPLEAAENADEALEEELSKLSAAEAAKRQRERRKKNAQKARDQLKLQLNMTTPMDIGLEAHAPGEDLFNLKSVDGKKVSNAQTPLSDSEEDEGNAEFMIIPQQEQPEEDSDADLDDEELRIKRLESNLDEMYDAYQNAKLERDTKHRAREARRKKRQEEGGEWGGIGQNSDSDDDAEESEADSEVQPGRDSTPDSDSDSDSDVDSNDGRERQQGKGNKRLLTDLRDPAQTKKRKLDAKERAAALWYDQAVFKGVPGLDALLQDEQEEEEEEDEPSEVEEMESSDEQLPGHIKTKGLFEPQEVVEWSSDEGDEADDYEVVPAKDYQDEEDKALERAERLGLNTAEAITLASQLVNREKSKSDLMDEGYNRDSFKDTDGMPAWFLDDEMRHFRKNVPVTKEAVEALRARSRALDARPIKKIAEAKARKKMRANRRMARLHKSADFINENPDMSEKEKAASINKLMAKAESGGKGKKSETKLVVARGANRGLKGRPKGVKGRYKMVDPRMKKEMRATKRIAKRDAGKRK